MTWGLLEVGEITSKWSSCDISLSLASQIDWGERGGGGGAVRGEEAGEHGQN